MTCILSVNEQKKHWLNLTELVIGWEEFSSLFSPQNQLKGGSQQQPDGNSG